MSDNKQAIPLNFEYEKDNEMVISHLFRMNTNDKKNKIVNEVSKLISSFTGSNDSRVPFWKKYETNYLSADKSKLKFSFYSPWNWEDHLSLNTDGSYVYKYGEDWGGFGSGATADICKHKGNWDFDEIENMILLNGIGYHLQKDYRVCGGAPKLKQQKEQAANPRLISASISIEQCLKSKRIEFAKVESTKKE